MQFRKKIGGLIIAETKNFLSKGFSQKGKSFHTGLPLQRHGALSTPTITKSLQVPFAEKTKYWEEVVQGMGPNFVSQHAFSLLNAPVVISRQQANILCELKPEVRQTALQLWIPLEKYPLNHQLLFNEYVAMINREKTLWADPKVAVPFNLGIQLNWLGALAIFNEDNFKKMMHSPQKMHTVLAILMRMKNKMILNDDASLYQDYLNRLLHTSSSALSALDEALQKGPYTTKDQIDMLLTISDRLHQLCPVHIFLHAQGWLTDDRLKRCDYAESAQAVLNILNVPGTSERTFDELVKNHQLAYSLWVILESFKNDLPLQKACLPLLFDHLDQLSLIYKKLPIIKEILSYMAPEAAAESVKILFSHDNLNKIDQLAELARSSPTLFKNMTVKVLSLSLKQIETTQEKETTHTIQSYKC